MEICTYKCVRVLVGVLKLLLAAVCLIFALAQNEFE